MSARMTREEYNARNSALDNYLNTQRDVNAAAIQDAANKGLTPESVGQENYENVLRNFAVGHITTRAIKNSENRVDAEGNDILANFASSPSGRNINLSVIGAVDAGQPVFEYVNVDTQGDRVTHYTNPGAGEGGGDPDVPLLGSFPDTTIPDPSDNGDGIIYGPPPGDTGGDDFIYGPPPGDTGGGIMSEPVDLAPVTSLIGTPGAGQTGTQSTLMGQTAGLATGQQGIRDVVDPLAEQVTGIGTSIGTAGTGQADTLMGQTADIQSGIGTAGTGTESGTGLVGGQERLGIGQSLLSLGQGQLGQQIGQSGGTLTNTATGETATTAPTGLYAGQAGLGQQIGTAAVTGEDGTVTQKPTGLYAGQAGLMSGQTGLGTQLTGVGRDLTTEIGDVSSALGSQLGAFRTAAENYQRGATTQRGDIQGTQRANQANMLSQIQGVGQPINRQAEALANQRQQEAASFAASQAPLQQQIANLTANNANQAANNQPIGPLGPMAADPRDALIQQLLTRNASLMNNRPV